MAFEAMIAALFADTFLAKSAAYLPKGESETRDVRVIMKRPDMLTSFGGAQIHSATSLLDVQVAEVPSPQVGDQFTVDGVTYAVQSEPMADSERLVWTLDMVAA